MLNCHDGSSSTSTLSNEARKFLEEKSLKYLVYTFFHRGNEYIFVSVYFLQNKDLEIC